MIARRVLAVATRMQARTAGLDGLDLPMQDLPDGMGRGVKSGLGALAGAHINSVLAVADADVAVASGLRACS
ncbi:hypothetical protein GOHSU_14_00850 [Gordonia hirsuta DSM 44140 = NBRC 16056]|uniref:Uncharacterized protein n=1 Tax=Gordonia hirsuta DSM 44140 = NBRC 16056 TaxID=1121927 RepID=L7LA55_9ACTN|nr:hypothetical protein GOHSU_14_00850 [Gordonia hirsuta DSM 44140 = NBRC 16056]